MTRSFCSKVLPTRDLLPSLSVVCILFRLLCFVAGAIVSVVARWTFILAIYLWPTLKPNKNYKCCASIGKARAKAEDL